MLHNSKCYSYQLYNEFSFFNVSLLLLGKVLLNTSCVYASNFEDPFLSVRCVFDTTTLAEGFCWQGLGLWAQSQRAEVPVQADQTREDSEQHTSALHSPTTTAQNGLGGQIAMSHLRTRKIPFLAQLQSFHWSFAPFLKLWLIYLGLHSCLNSRGWKSSCYLNGDFYFLQLLNCILI